MPDPDLTPEPERRRAEQGGHTRADDDIELPPMPDESPQQSSEAGSLAWSDSGGNSGSVTSWLVTAGIVGAMLFGGWMAVSGGSAEQDHPNWQHVTAASDASTGSSNYLTHVDGTGVAQLMQSLELSSSEAARAATEQIRLAMLQGDLAAATAALQAAQAIPNSDVDVQLPDLATNPQLKSVLEDTSNELYELVLSDCCDEDGDIVEVIVNGVSFATVPILHAGTKVSIPLGRGNNTVTIRGIRDGGGGVTLSFQTSRGDYFCRSMGVGEEYHMGVVVQ